MKELVAALDDLVRLGTAKAWSEPGEAGTKRYDTDVKLYKRVRDRYARQLKKLET